MTLGILIGSLVSVALILIESSRMVSKLTMERDAARAEIEQLRLLLSKREVVVRLVIPDFVPPCPDCNVQTVDGRCPICREPV